MVKNRKAIYLNSKQIEFAQSPARVKVALWGRGTGKTTEMGVIETQRVEALPRARSFLSSSTYGQILDKSIAPMEKIWNNMGYRHYDPRTNFGHYIIGQKPPKWFKKPIFKIHGSFKNVISWWNGYTTECLSMDRPDVARGGNYDCGHIDEAALVKKGHINKVLLPAVRANLHVFNSPLHHQVCMFSSMPWKTSGDYLFEYKQKMVDDPDFYFYSEATAHDNLHILGKDYIELQRKECTPMEFQVEIMNKRIKTVPNGFYPRFRDYVHLYKPGYDYKDDGPRGIEAVRQGVVKPNELLDLTMDFSGWFNGGVVFQYDSMDHIEYGLSSHYVKDDRNVLDLVDDICVEYENHKNKHIRLWGEPRGHDRQALGDTIYNQVKRRFEANGWRCTIKAPAGRSSNHEQRHYFMDEVLEEKNPRLPKLRLHEDKARDVAIAIQLTPILPNMKKDKGKEKDRDFPQEMAPHFTDMVDYYIEQKHFNKLIRGSGRAMSAAVQ